MEERTGGRWRSRPPKGDDYVADVLRRSWCRLRLSVRHPARAPTWDAIVLTAASPQQAELYDWQLRRAKRMGRIAEATVTLAVPDPGGARIGSGAATLHALAALSLHLARLGLVTEVPEDLNDDPLFAANGEPKSDLPSMTMIKFMAKSHILLLHAGGDSKRVPWANPMGKVFLPLPYLAADSPDGPVPLLFDHILAISSCARQAFKNEGGIFIMTGDVLPCFDASMMVIPNDAPCIVTVPITLDIASNHGVVVASDTGILGENCSVSVVDYLLQKPNIKELIENKAIRNDGRALLDSGIIAVRGKAWVKLLMLARSSQKMLLELLKSRKEMSLYEDLVAAWVPAKHEWLKSRPLGKKLIKGLGSQKMVSYCAHDLTFLHFGTSSEVMDHLSGSDSVLVGRRHLCSIPATTVCDIAASAIILSSKISPGISVGEDSLVYDSSLSGNIQIGSQSIVVGVNIQGDSEYKLVGNLVRFILPDRHCLWEVPLVGHTGRVIIYCGLHDNPKSPFTQDGTFCGKPWRKVLYDLGIQEKDLWTFSGTQEACLWNAKIFSIRSYFEMLSLAMWFMGSSSPDESMLSMWRDSPRISLEELHRSVDFPLLCMGSINHQANLAAEIAKACINYGILGRNLSQLCEEILQNEIAGIEICKDFLALCPTLQAQDPAVLPRSRAYQVQVDLLRACGEEEAASMVEQKVWAEVANETASAVKYGFGGPACKSSIAKGGYSIPPPR
uniref:Bifunctional fucokinase/fucose pyrophosphorylase n=1 Tax=Anthurium amnicola TaxID=1678845 RepID=A0A1D1XL93_9ARAE